MSEPLTPPEKTKAIVTLIYPDANSIDVSGPLQVFSTTNRLLKSRCNRDKDAYTTEIIGAEPHPIQIAAGLNVVPAYNLNNPPTNIDTLFIAGGMGAITTAENSQIREWILNIATTIPRLASICTGAFILAATGLLNNRKATTHWQYIEKLKEAYPSIQLEADAIFTRDKNIYCSAGVTSGIDLALAMVEDDWGHELALDVARQLVVFLKRPGGQSQFSALLDTQAHSQSPINAIQQWVLQHLSDDLSIDVLAEKAAMSARHFSRVFQKETGLSPGKFILRARLDRARDLLESTELPLMLIAEQCGIGNNETLRRLFWQHFQTSPKTYRERFSTHHQ
ncbi:MAG: GlxA family transcriptional regulator [Cellvibrionaceae bacterium]